MFLHAGGMSWKLLQDARSTEMALFFKLLMRLSIELMPHIFTYWTCVWREIPRSEARLKGSIYVVLQVECEFYLVGSMDQPVQLIFSSDE